MKTIQTKLLEYLEEANLASVFELINNSLSEELLEKSDLPFLNELILEYISGNYRSNFYGRVRTFITTSIKCKQDEVESKTNSNDLTNTKIKHTGKGDIVMGNKIINN